MQANEIILDIHDEALGSERENVRTIINLCEITGII